MTLDLGCRLGKIFITLICGLNVLATSGYAQSKPADTIQVRPSANYSADAKVGSYGQPEWTTHRHFSTSRSYVIPQGTLGAELWVKAHKYKDNTPNDYLVQQEIEYGLSNRLQLDLYVNEVNEVRDGKRMWDMEGIQYEIRWAMADWGKIPMNPTWYFEYHPVKNAPEKAEVRLLLSDDIATAWHYSANLGYEIQLWGEERERELILTLALGTTALAQNFSVGAEIKGEWTDTKNTRGHMHPETMIGPSFNWRPTRSVHVDFAPLFGLQDDAPQSELWLIVGTELF
jgi:hypothetical protein